MVVGEIRGLRVEFIDVRSLNDGVSMTGKIAVALVIGDHDDDIWFLCEQSQGKESENY